MKFLVRLGAVIQDRRVQRGLSQQELGDCAGLHRTYISDVERGRRNMTVLVLTRIADCLDVRVEKLLRSAEQPDR